NVTLCSHIPISSLRPDWENKMRSMGQNPTQKAWQKFCDNVCDGYVWNMAMLNQCDHDELRTEIRVVDFHRLYTIPRVFLESLLLQRGQTRLRLLPPYREHLSQAFARYYMRVGLPVAITKNW